MYGNPSLSKLCRKNPIRNVVGWYKMSFMVYFELVLVWKEIFGEKGKIWPFLFLLDTLLLGEPEAEFSKLSNQLRRNYASPSQTSPPRRSIASPRRTYKSCFVFSLPLILVIIHWINKDSNK